MDYELFEKTIGNPLAEYALREKLTTDQIVELIRVCFDIKENFRLNEITDTTNMRVKLQSNSWCCNV